MEMGEIPSKVHVRKKTRPLIPEAMWASVITGNIEEVWKMNSSFSISGQTEKVEDEPQHLLLCKHFKLQ